VKLESLAYYLFGNNVIIGPHIRRQIDFLSRVIPETFKHREMDDLGCGDGKVTLLLKDIFLPSKLRGFDIDASLVRRARGRGIDAEIKNLDTDMPSGELAVLWGVLHHLKDCGDCLKNVRESYPLIFVREPVRNSFFRWLEMGQTLRQAEIEALVNEHLPGSLVHYCGNSVMIFFTSDDNINRR
jgi:SAM-dependent methyltransferase